MNKERPVNFNVDLTKLPITSTVSILHRASGVFLFAGTGLLLWMLAASLKSAQSFAELQEVLASGGVKFAIWLVLAALIYHTVAGVRHLIMDLGIGESLEAGVLGAQLTLACSVILALLAGVWLW
ncbi:MAG: succinate dehydrogenase, cytochrome b556 subunit [Pseudomonadales bacterium]